MPIIDGVKMACASCIRGHRSTTCQHTDRPMLQVRKKGRPLTQCDHCRDLRKVKQVHVRCICVPDESEAPKRRKGKDAAKAQEHNGCDCDNTGICNCAVPRTVASRTGRKYAGGEDRVSSQPTAVKSNCSSPSCTHTDGCSSSGEDGCCSTSSSQSSSANSNPTPPSCCPPTLHPTSVPVSVNPLETFLPAPTSFDVFDSTLDASLASYISPTLNNETFLPQQQTRQKAARYTPYPQSFSAMTAPGVPHVAPPFHANYSFEASLPVLSPPSDDDARTAQLWDQFLRDEQIQTVVDDQAATKALPPTTLTPSPLPAVAGASPIEGWTPPSDDAEDLCDDGCICVKCLTKVNPCLGEKKSDGQMLDCAILMANLNLDDDEVASNMSMMSGLRPAQLRTMQKEAKFRLEEIGMAAPSSDERIIAGAQKSFEDSLRIPSELRDLASPTSTSTQSATTSTTAAATTTPPPLGLSTEPLHSKCTCPPGCTCFSCSGNTQPNSTSDINCTPCVSCAALSESILDLQRTLNVANLPSLA